MPRKNEIINYANRGQAFEEIINWCNTHYLNKKVAYIIKVPIPIKILKEAKGRITSAFREPSLALDYIGTVKGRSIYFDAKEVESTTSFPLRNLEVHQFEYMKQFEECGGYAFLLISFTKLNRVYKIDYSKLKFYFEQHLQNPGIRGFHSIPIEEFETSCRLVKSRNGIVYDFLEGLY